MMKKMHQTTLGMGTWVVLGAALLLSACAPAQTSQPLEFQTIWPDPDEPRFYFEQRISSSGDVVEMSTQDRLKAFATGGSTGGNGIAKPYSVAAQNGRMYVSDSVARMVHVFEIENGKYFEIGTDGPGALAKPLGLALDEIGNVYVVDSTQKRVVVFDRDGKFLNAIDGRRYFDRPTGIAVNKDGSKVFVVDAGGVSSVRHRVVVFDKDGNYVQDIGKRGENPGEFNLPLNAAIGPDGLLYVVDSGNFRVQAFTQMGQFKFAFGDIGRRSGQFARPKAIALDKDNNIYVTDAAFGNVQIFSSDQKLLMWIGARSTQDLPGKYMLPVGVAVDRETGKVYLSDQYFRKVDIYRPVALGPPDSLEKK